MDSNTIKAIQELDSHLQRRNQIRQMLMSKDILMLDSPVQTISNMAESNLQPTQSLVYKQMKQELASKGFNEFRFLGQGAQGLVLLAKQQHTNRRYAIKGVHIRLQDGSIDSTIQQQVEQEVKLLKTCQGSPYVLNLIDQFDGQDFTYLVLSECKGTLSQIIQQTQKNKLNEFSTIKYAKDIAEGLYYIHSKKCLVNDIKMDNILIDHNGNAVVADFGFADCFSKTHGFGANECKGNDFFKAPECFKLQGFDDYVDEYKKRGLTVSSLPCAASEACSLGYLIYTMIQGWKFQLMFSKHQPLSYDSDFSKLTYEKQLRYIIEGLTNFNPSDRLSIKEVLIILKGIVSFEFDLDEKFVQLMNEDIQGVLNQSFNQSIEFASSFKNQCYPIIQDENSLIQQIQILLKQGQAGNSNQINQLNQTIIQQKQQIQSLSGQVNQLQQELQKSQNENQKIASYSNQINQLNQTIIQYKQQIQSLDGQVKQLHEKLSNCQNENQKTNQTNISLKEKISSLEAKLQEFIQKPQQNNSQKFAPQQVQMNMNQQIQQFQPQQVVNAWKRCQGPLGCLDQNFKLTYEKCASGGTNCYYYGLGGQGLGYGQYYCVVCDACRMCEKKFH